MKKLTALCAIMVIVFASCTNVPAPTAISHIDTVKAVFTADTINAKIDTISSDTVNHK